MKTKLFLFITTMVLSLGNYPAQAAHVHEMDHANHATMDHAGMDHGAKPAQGAPSTEDVGVRIPAISSPGHGNHDHGQPGGKKACAHHEVCPSDHICEMKDHQCHTVAGPASFDVCSLSAECGGGLPFQSASLPSLNHETILTFYANKKFKTTSFFLPHVVEVALAGFPGELEHPPQASSL